MTMSIRHGRDPVADEALSQAPTLGLVPGAPMTWRGVSSQEALADYRMACLSRATDERQLILHKQGRAYFHISGEGHEILLIGVARSLRPGYDWFFPYYRDLALVLALGVQPRDVLYQAVGAAADPASGGRQMPSHWGDKRLNIATQSSPTGSQCIPAVGCAEGGRYIARRGIKGLTAHTDEVVYVSLGDGATSEGEFWESLNTSCRLRLPVVYVIEDNGYAISVPVADQAPGPISDLVSGFPGLEVVRADGCDYFDARQKGAAAIARARAGEGPALIHGRVIRLGSHSSSDNQKKYRDKQAIEHDLAADPVRRFRDELIRAGVLTEALDEQIRAEVRELVAEAAQEALAADKPDPKSVMDHLVVLPEIPEPAAPPEDGEPVMFGEAIRRTLFEVMAADERVRVLGEDVADASEDDLEGLGGVFGLTAGLQRAFGKDRCYNTPLAEANIIGRGVGQAIRGLHPSPEIQFFDYIWTGMQQLRSEAATTRWRSNGAFNLPMVIRTAIGGYLHGGGIWHSQSGESIFTHIPGFIVIFPSRARDVAGLLRAAFRCEDPVLFLEHKHLFRQRYTTDPFPPPGYVVPIGKAATRWTGDDLTIVTWGATVQRSLVAAEKLAADSIEVEVIDLRTLVPYDREAIAASVRKTGRCLVVHEDVITSGFGAEIAAFVASECFEDLDAPVRRFAAPDTWVGYEPGIERAVLPQPDDIAAAARELVVY
ncbi:MAG: dehydrogenase E1 component subunit alpha/beta [Acidimicrobiales bacterium]